MTVRVFIYGYRKPGLSLSTFRERYEAHIDLVRRISGEDFPLSHRRTYIARTTVDSPPAGATARNATTPATLLLGQQSDFDFDTTAELTFADQPSFQAFMAKVTAPEAAAQIAEDEERFFDRKMLSIAMIGEVVETNK
ncbi:EthD domain-domain-containing protein [Aspergillus welwitschiae]|uniref:EthD domain-domain-containing protein n=1 Tax=Aspergillus welwitschiae TaxID=1341132 RepID=A0A3F3QCR3_9EURO|nr:EthD domain-domain-containing protein [Aspergillus welwitschiae]RDH36596.1 EthD domain-domain-containing protein [Aspergillus welwitschiae]